MSVDRATAPPIELHYSSQPRRRTLFQRLGLLAAAVCCAAGAAIAVYSFQPLTYVSVGYLQPPLVVGTMQQQDVAEFEKLKQTHVQGLTTTAIAPAVASLRGQKIIMTHAYVLSHLKVTPVRESLLIEVSFADRNPNTAAAVVNAVVTSHLSTSPGMRYVAAAIPPTRPHEQFKLPAMAALVAFVAAVALLRRLRPFRGQ
jgi:capsular polysaccharide biosynthesis protein